MVDYAISSKQKIMLADTIVARATASGVGGIGIVRVSGKDSKSIAQPILDKNLPEPRYAEHAEFLDEDGSVIDEGLVLYFKAPNSFTGEDVIEFQGHGGIVVLDRLIQRILKLGARMARAGEFSERAFLNGKIDLIQAEAIADLIDASSNAAAKSAINSLKGEFSKKIKQLVEYLIELRCYVEGAIDFSDEEDVSILLKTQIDEKLTNLKNNIVLIREKAKKGALLQSGLNVVIAGLPNSGKSSLLNKLSQQNVAIVTDIAGTTRDILKQSVQIDGLLLHLVDTAGIRDKTEDVIEEEGIKRAKSSLKEADHVLLVIDATEDIKTVLEIFEKIISNKTTTLVINKIDLLEKKSSVVELFGYESVYVSAKTGEGIELFQQFLKKKLGLDNFPEDQFIARRRHLDALDRAMNHIDQAQLNLSEIELLAEELHYAQNALSEITGEFRPDDLLGSIFSHFCIGK